VFVNTLGCYNKVKAKFKKGELGFGKLDTGEIDNSSLFFVTFLVRE